MKTLKKIGAIFLIVTYILGLFLGVFYNKNIYANQVNTIDLTNIEQFETTSEINDNYFGLNGYGALALESGSSDEFIENLKILNPQNYRFHDFIQSDSGINFRAFGDDQNQSWDRVKINQFANMIRKWRQNGINPEFTVTIASFPSWMSTQSIDGVEYEMLEPSEYQNFAEFVAELVKILNVEENLGIQKIEITNELDVKYGLELENNGLEHRIDDLADIYIQAAQEVKKVDSNIKIGGLSFAQPFRSEYLDSFLMKVSDYPELIDFLSVHTYASGDKTESTETILGRGTRYPISIGNLIKSLLNKNNLNIPYVLNEYNISWTYTNNDERMRTFTGSIYESLTFIASLKSGFSLITAWNDKDDIYGKMDNSYRLIPSANVYSLLNSNLTSGDILNFEMENEDLVNILVKDQGVYKFFIVNRSPTNEVFNFELPDNIVNTKYLTANQNNITFDQAQFSNSLTNLGYSINYFEFETIIEDNNEGQDNVNEEIVGDTNVEMDNTDTEENIEKPATKDTNQEVINTNNNPVVLNNNNNKTSNIILPRSGYSNLYFTLIYPIILGFLLFKNMKK